LVSLKEIRRAARRLVGVARRTPLHRAAGSEELGASAGGGVWLKCENLQHGGAFKLRGAYNFMARLTAAERERGVVTYSSGNHAQGVAYAARVLGISATVVMPTDAPRVKLEATRGMGARIEQVGTTTVERKARAEELLRERGGTMVPPFDHPAIIAGQGTTGLEIVEQLAALAPRAGREDEGRPALVVVPVGGGGLLSGVAAAVRALHPDARIVGVEPRGAPKMRRSLDAGHPVTLERIDTVADGLKPVRPGDLTFAHCRALVDDVVTVGEADFRRGVRWCFGHKLVVEPSGAAGIAALLSGQVRPAGVEGATVVVLSGGNIQPSLLCEWVSESAGAA